MMNCTEFQNKLAEHVIDAEDGMNTRYQAIFDQHRRDCDCCQSLYESKRAATTEMLGGLRKMPVPEASAGFADRVLSAAVAGAQNEASSAAVAGGQSHRRGFAFGFGSAAVVGLSLWVAVGLFPQSKAPSQESGAVTVAAHTPAAEELQQPQPTVMNIALNQQQNIKLAFYSGEALQGAKITIRLPENVALVGYPGRTQLSWRANLNKGDNVLNLPVMATQVARGDLVANIEYGDQRKILTLSLEARATDALKNRLKLMPFVG
jgi:hypothetical protein